MEVRLSEIGPIPPVSAQTPARAEALPPLRTSPELAAALPQIGDSVVLLLQELSQPDLGKLLAILDRLPLPESSPEIDLPSVASADRLLLKTKEPASSQQLASNNPHVAQDSRLLSTLSTSASLALHPPLAEVPHRVLAVAHLEAENKVGQAARLIDDLHPARLSNWDAKPEVLLHLARTLVDAGTYVNYVRAADLSQIMIDALRFMPVIDAMRVNDTLSSRFVAGIKRVPWPIALPIFLVLVLLFSILFGWWGSH